jgi:hypothetical protein
MMMKAFVTAAALIPAVSFAQEEKVAIVGRWEATDRTLHFQFFADGRVSASTFRSKSGTYVLDEKGTLLIALSDGTRLITRVSMSKTGQLVMTDADGSFVTFNKVE